MKTNRNPTEREKENHQTKKCRLVGDLFVPCRILLNSKNLHLRETNGWNLTIPPLEKEKQLPFAPIFGFQQLVFRGVLGSNISLLTTLGPIPFPPLARREMAKGVCRTHSFTHLLPNGDEYHSRKKSAS